MPVSSSIQSFPARDVKALFTQMNRASRELNIPIGKAVRMAGNMIARTMGTSTRLPTRDVKAKKRVVTEVRGPKTAGGNKKFKVISWAGGSKRTFFVFAKNKREANKRRSVQIRKYGLAKATWVRLASRIGRAGASAGATASAKKAAARAGRVNFRFKGDDPFVALINELPYAETALQGGANDVITAMARAARGLSKSIDEQLKRKMGAA